MDKIAFLFLTMDNVGFPNIWEDYFKDNMDKINIYCHPKNKDLVTNNFLKNNIISNIKETSWGDLLDAILSLLTEALNDNTNNYFVLISDSCLPIKSFDSFYNFLFGNNKNISYVDLNDDFLIDKKESIEYLYRKKGLGKYFDRDYKFTKHSQWFCLSRYHVNKLLNDKMKSTMNKFINIHTGEELFLTVLFPDENIKNFPINYANWKEKYKAVELTKKINNLWIEYDKSNHKDKFAIRHKINKLIKIRKNYGAHPKLYSLIDINTVNEIQSLDSFFLRKFSIDSNINDFYKILLFN